ncbi:DoxX family protein [Paenibacillus cellulosilyticus]|uniref:DoxX family protein n=1 Tax=Paenibacillus cellulosilyticus TaxID=375489 RepID=UPI000D7099A7|nr:DoxX family protein [Paenibacillus cellulosilyticus]QKS44824.1 DoxX family protein [Paenibacillus cellulosilyticus]
MIPLIALIVSWALFRVIGLLGASYFDEWHTTLQAAVAIMLLLTASAHWGAKRKDLVRMVPPAFPQPGRIVSITGYLEIAGAIGIMIPALSLYASIGLVLLLIAMFPANIYAARHKLTLSGRPVPSLPVRTLIQIIFLTVVVLASPLFN